jgi:hypothetical protein
LAGLLQRSGIPWRGFSFRLPGYRSIRLADPSPKGAKKFGAPISWLEHRTHDLFLERPSWQVVATILSLLTLIRLWAAAHAGLAPDEAYYWLWSQTPALGYSDHPPMVAWWIWLSTTAIGDSALGVRMPPLLSVLVASLAVFGTARLLFPLSLLAHRAVLWFNAMILVGVGAIFSTPDAPSAMFWALTVWALSAIWRTGRSQLWLLVGVFAGLGCVSKYTNLFLGPGILLWLLIDSRMRRWLWSPWLWAGGVVALVVFAPVLLWNAEHGWISFYKQFGRLAGHQITLRYLGEFLLSQAGLLNPVITFFFILAVMNALTRRAEIRPNPSLVLLATLIPLVAYMIVHAFHDRVQANWLAPIYPQLAIVAVAYAENQNDPWRRVRLERAVVPLGMVISVLSLLYLANPVKLPFPIQSLVARLEGWQEFATIIEELRKRNHARWIATANYDVNAELAFYFRGRPPVREIVERERYESNPLDLSLPNQQALLILSEREKASGRFDHCFMTVQPIAIVPRRSVNELVERYVVESVTSATAEILSAGCDANATALSTAPAPENILSSWSQHRNLGAVVWSAFEENIYLGT